MKNLLFRKQFLLTKEDNFSLKSWKAESIADYSLFYHPELPVCCCKQKERELILIGYLFSHEHHKKSNKDILEEIFQSSGTAIIDIIKATDAFCGQFVILYKNHGQLFLFSDACAQREVFYTKDCTTIGSQISLIETEKKLEEDNDPEAIEFYNSPVFQSKRNFLIGETNKKDVKHLKANHYLHLNVKKEIRFFPMEPLPARQLKEVAAEAATMLKGFVRAANFRYKLAIPVTAGYDSRVIFGASLEEECRYFIFKHRKLHEHHPDITIPKRILNQHGKKLEVLSYKKEISSSLAQIHKKSIDFHRPDQTEMIFNGYFEQFGDYMILNGNVAEIARNFYGNFRNVTGTDLAFITKTESYPYAVKIYNEWVAKNEKLFKETNHHIMDMFYWEERMNNWAAKGKTETLLGTEIFSPFNSRKLLTTLLSTNRKHRETQINDLFDHILFLFSPKLLKEPINPDPTTRMIIVMRKIGIYNFYRHLGLKYRFLKF